ELKDARVLWQQVQESMATHAASGWHLLFPDDETREALAELPLVARQACHFRWNNRGYASFDDFLAALVSRKRKNIRKERAAILQTGLRIEWRQGADIPAEWWTPFYHCYAMTYYRRGQQPYLPPAFFRQLASSSLASQLALAVAFNGDEMIAAAFYLLAASRLYGRHWGSVADVDGLHFEL